MITAWNVKAAVICISQDSESRNEGAQKLLAEEKQEQSDSFTSIISPVPDAVQVTKRKRQSLANWFLIVDEYCINLVLQVRELRNDPFLSPKLTPLVPLSAVRNRDRQDVESTLQISHVKVKNIIEQHVTNVTHTVIPEKCRLTDDNKKGSIKKPIGVCLAPMGHVFVSDIGVGKVFKVRVSHYLANVTVEIDSLGCPIGIAVYGNVLYCADAKNDIIAFKDLTGETVVEVNKLTVKQLQEKLKAIGAWDENDKRKTKSLFKTNYQLA